MTTLIKDEDNLVVPVSLQRRAGIKAGDRVVFTVGPRSITITAAPTKTYKPTKAELSAIHKGEAAFARGDHLSLSDFLHALDRPGRQPRPKTARKVSR